MLRPTKSQVLILPDIAGPVSTVLFIPATAQNRDIPSTGTVVAIGGKVITKNKVVLENEFAVGDHVVFKKHTGLFVEHQGKKYLNVPAMDVLAVLS